VSGASVDIDVRILAFDVFGTVVDWRSGVVAAAEGIGGRRGVRGDWGPLADAWRAAYQPGLDRVRRGEVPWTRLDRLLRSSLDELLPRFGLTALPQEDRDELTRAWRMLPPWPDVPHGLPRLRSRFIVATLSNGSLGQLVDLARYGGLTWDCILSAELVSRYKPDAEVYLQVPRLFDVRPNQVLMVAAHADDLLAAGSSGLRTAFVHRPLEHGPGRRPHVEPSSGFDYVARDFLDLAAQLGT
jgi:2-haloacid dehalogenase